VAFDEAFAAFAVALPEVEPTGLTRQFAELGKGTPLLGLDKPLFALALVTKVHCGDKAPLLSFLNLVTG
jgi:hypothetical protein